MPRRRVRRRQRGGQQTRLRLKQMGQYVETPRREELPVGSRPEQPLSPPMPREYGGELTLSVVTASYERLKHLKQMVGSVRASLRSSVPYEIVVVDGGSGDGTQEWCYKEPDVVLLKGDLRGAVPNFNVGFQAAKGRYVCMANDDVEFVGDSLQLALDFMVGHPRVGAGCIAHSRPSGQTPWVSLMEVDLRGASKHWPMAQVAVVPRWLGDRLGWWGNVTTQYYGDELLSRRIWEEGFTVSIVPDAWIRDHKISDGLRKRNNGLNRGRKDAASFKRLYPHRAKVGGRPSMSPPFPTLDGDRPDVDIVLGTYNRRALLQGCIESYRWASKGLRHRFIVVDGGSTDGTLDYLRGQPDVLLIESGVLDGAVRAFNRGFARATADYVVNANDDMQICEGMLSGALQHLEASPNVGQLAFPTTIGHGAEYKNHDCWGHTFANFGMTRRWLGNYVGWWGNWTEKYFGDVHCSLRIWGLGYRVEVYGGCKCLDHQPQDGLRGPVGGNVQCAQESETFEERWPYREGKTPVVKIPDGPVVWRADFE